MHRGNRYWNGANFKSGMADHFKFESTHVDKGYTGKEVIVVSARFSLA